MDEIRIKDLKIFPNKDGDIFKMLDSGCPEFKGFGEVYFSRIHSQSVKAWKKHKEMTLNLAVPFGRVEFVFYDDRMGREPKIQKFVLGEEDYKLLTVPPGIWFGFKGLDARTSIVVNCADITHRDSEVERVSIEDNFIPYSWV